MSPKCVCFVILLLACSRELPDEVVRVAPRSCNRPNAGFLGLGTVYSPNCEKQLLWGTPSTPCFEGTDVETVFLVNDFNSKCTSTGAIFHVKPTEFRELWTNDPVCHCVELGTDGPCAERSDDALLFEYTQVQPVNCYPSGLFSLVSRPKAMTEAQIRTALK